MTYSRLVTNKINMSKSESFQQRSQGEAQLGYHR